MSRLAAGTASLGNVFGEVADDVSDDLLRACLETGVSYLDSAPLYGVGLSERRLGAALRSAGREHFTISTKVGRTLSADAEGGWTHDFSRDAILRGVEGSLNRLGLDRIDVLYLHDAEQHERAVYDSAWPALVELRDGGLVSALGVGSNEWQFPLRLVERLPVDVVLLAGRYTLLDTSGAEQLLPQCLDRGVAVALAGVFNSGILADPSPGAWFDYRPASAGLIARAQRLRVLAARYGVSLPHLAIAFASAHPAATTTIVGVGSRRELVENARALETPIPAELWSDIEQAGLLPSMQFVHAAR